MAPIKVTLVGAEFEENLALRSLWGALERAGHSVKLVVFNHADELERAAREVLRHNSALTGFSLVFTRRAREFAELIERCRTLGYRGHITAGGHFAALNALSLLDDLPALDSVVIGEGEGPLCELADSLFDLNTINGLVWRDDKGEIVENERAEKPPELDRLAWPVHRRPFDTFLGIPIANMISSRGCTKSCSFCSISAWHTFCGGKRFRLRSPEQIAEEMAMLFSQGVRIFNFHDDNFVLSSIRKMHQRLDNLDHQLKIRGVRDIAFAIKARPDDLDRDLLLRMKKMGLFRIFLGVEAGSDRALSSLGRGTSISDNIQALKNVNELAIHTCFNLILFNPESTLEDLRDNVHFLEKNCHNPMNFCRAEVYSGTPLERFLLEKNMLIGDYWGFDYKIEDRRSQCAFEIVYPAFYERNFGEIGLHHEVMKVDYEYHVLERFYGKNVGLKREIKDFIKLVNLDTCRHLFSIFDGVENGFNSEDHRLCFEEEMIDQVTSNSRVLLEKARQLTSALRRDREKRSNKTTVWIQRAAVAGLAATLSLGAATCSQRQTETHPNESVPTSTHLPDAQSSSATRSEKRPTVSEDDAGFFSDASMSEKVPQRPQKQEGKQEKRPTHFFEYAPEKPK